MVNKAALTAGNPEGDVLFGVDNTLLSRARDGRRCSTRTPRRPRPTSPELRSSGTDGAVTPIDYGDVCVNVDTQWFAARGSPPPTTLDDLALPAYRDQLVVENAATSSPGSGVPAGDRRALRRGRLRADYWPRCATTA